MVSRGSGLGRGRRFAPELPVDLVYAVKDVDEVGRSGNSEGAERLNFRVRAEKRIWTNDWKRRKMMKKSILLAEG